MKVGELCSGYGGISLGLKLAGEDVDLRWLAESDPALDVLHPTGIPNLGDITTVDWTAVEPVDLLTAGFPCQPVSAAGAQLAEADPRWLWPEVRRAVAAMRPPRVLLENVRNLISMRKGEIWRYILADLTALGYDVTWLTLGACAVGAAHHRHRVFALATYSPYTGLSVPVRLDVQECGARRGSIATVLPTPGASDYRRGNSTRRSGDRSDEVSSLIGIAHLLPSPSASSYGSNQGGAAGRVGPVRHSLDSMARLDLLPSPQSRDGQGRGTPSVDTAEQRFASGRRNLDDGLALLPTPRATDGVNGGPGQRGSSGDLAMPSAVQPEHWGRFAAAVARHAATFGPPPAPTEPNRNGAPRLAPAFAEWLMCIPAGHVTDALPRSQALKAIGNGVCPPQLAQAWRYLTGLDRPSDTSIGFHAMTSSTTTTSQDVKDIQDRQSNGRGAVIDATMVGGITVDPALIEAAMMALVEHWRAEADIWEASKKRGGIGTAKELRQCASRLAGFAVGLTSRPVTNITEWPKDLVAPEGAAIVPDTLVIVDDPHLPQCNCDRPECAALYLGSIDDVVAALPVGDPVATILGGAMTAENPEQLMAFMRGETDDPGVVHAVRGGIQFPSPFGQRTAGPGEIVPSDLTGDGPMFPGQIGYRAAEHGRPKAPCYECMAVDEDPAPWCDCTPEDGQPCKGPCRLEAHMHTFHPQGCTHYARTTNPDPSRCLYCHETLTPPAGDPMAVILGDPVAAVFAEPGDDSHIAWTPPVDPSARFEVIATSSEEQNLRDIIGPLGASATALVDNPFTRPNVPWLNRPAVAVVPYQNLPAIATATGTRDHVSHSYVEGYESCSLASMLKDASRAGHIGAQRPGWSQIAGKAFHAAVETVERAALTGVSFFAIDATISDIEAFWMSHLDAQIKEQMAALVGTPYADSGTWYVSNRGKEGFDWWRVEGARMLKLYLDFHTPAWRAANQTFLLQDKTPVIELEYDMTIRSLDQERGLQAKGFIDKATLNMETYSLTVLDYKTGARDPDSTFQLGEYGHALLMAMGIAQEPADRPILGSYWLARKGVYTTPTAVLARHPMSELQYRYDQAARGNKAGIFAPHVSNFCTSCSVKDYCPTQAGRT